MADTADLEKLKPCPFCGESLQNNGSGVWLHGEQSDSACIIGAMGIMDTPARIAAWNTRITALEDHARALAEALRRHHEWHLKLGVVTFPAEEGQDEPTTLDMSAEYDDSSLGEVTRAALAEHQKIMGERK